MPAIALSLIFCAALSGAARFEPDWPPLFPIDAFEPRSGADWRGIEIELPVTEENKDGEAAANEDPANEEDTGISENGEEPKDKTRVIKLTKTSFGTLSAFPFWDGSDFLQIDVDYNDESIKYLRAARDELNIEVEILQTVTSDFYQSGLILPEIARVNIDGEYHFISFSYSGYEIIETWFNEEGIAETALIITMRQENKLQCSSIITTNESGSTLIRYEYDSFGNKISINTEKAAYSAIYNVKGIKYLTVQKQYDEPSESGAQTESGAQVQIESGVQSEQVTHYGYQKDERGLLVRTQIIGINAETGEDEVNYHAYTYLFDERGDWISREQSELSEQFGVLIPQGGAIIKRRFY